MPKYDGGGKECIQPHIILRKSTLKIDYLAQRGVSPLRSTPRLQSPSAASSHYPESRPPPGISSISAAIVAMESARSRRKLNWSCKMALRILCDVTFCQEVLYLSLIHI